jgi:hypothetical protein
MEAVGNNSLEPTITGVQRHCCCVTGACVRAVTLAAYGVLKTPLDVEDAA